MTAPVNIAQLRPWMTAEETDLRHRLSNAAVLSAARAVRAQSDRARQRFWLINEAANFWLVKSASNEELLDVVNALVRETLSADTFERLGGGLS